MKTCCSTRCNLLALVLVSCAVVSSAQATTVALNANRDNIMNGVATYADYNIGGITFVQTGRSFFEPTRSTISFDTTPLVGVFLPGYEVTGISMQLVTYANTQGSSAKATAVYAISDGNANWVEGTGAPLIQTGSASWNSRQHGSLAWLGTPGLNTPGTDYVNTLLSQQSFASNPANDQTITFNFAGSSASLTALISNWMNVANAGLLLLDPNELTLSDEFDRLTYYSREAANSAFRPMLFVTFVPPVPEPSSCLLLSLGTLLLQRVTRNRRTSKTAGMNS